MKDMISLSNLFNNKLFRIPDYQRGYAWAEPQLSDFWDDLVNLNGDRFHYTGMLSLKELSFDACKEWKEDLWLLEDDYKGYHVVDGQQRLTTCIILLNSILNFAKLSKKEVIKNKSVDEIRKKYIVEFGPLGLNKSYKFGYEIDNPSFNFLRYKILGEKYHGEINESFYTFNLQNAKDYFDKKLQKVFDEKGFGEIENLYLKLVNKFVFNIHYIDDDFDVFVAFETMNNRGKKLSNLEILKNRLIYLTTIYPDNVLPSNLKEALRKRINETWMEVYRQLGRDKKISLPDDEFLKNHWTIFYKYTRNQGDDYIQFLLNRQFTPKAVYGERAELVYSSIDADSDVEIDSFDNDDEILSPKEIIDYVDSLKDLAKYWYYSFNPKDNQSLTSEEVKWVDKLNRIGMNYFRTLVVTSMWSDQVTSEQRVALFKTIEKFIFLCFRLAKYNATYNSVNSYKYARSLYKKEVSIDEIISFFNNEFERNKEDAIKAFQNDIERLFRNYDGFYSWYPRWYFLFEYEEYLSCGRNTKLNSWSDFTNSSKDKISIEHIYPQKPTAWYWRNQFRKYTNEDEQHALANSLGNLLALSQSINSSLQNKEFYLKKTSSEGRIGYDKGSYSEQEVARKKDWSPEEILNRGLNLLSFMEQRWDISLGDLKTKTKILGLTFLNDGRPDVLEIPKVDYQARDINFLGGINEVKVSCFLKNKDSYLVNYYFKIFDALKTAIPSIYETATKNYITLRTKDSVAIIAEVHIQNSKKNVLFLTKAPSNAENNIGTLLSDNHLWSKNYKVILKENDDFSKLVLVIKDYYDRLVSGEITNKELEQNEKQMQKEISNYYIACLNEYCDELTILTKARRYTRFVSKKIRSVVGFLGDGSWSGIKDLIVWEIDNRKTTSTLSLVVGPASTEARTKWLDYCRKIGKFEVGRGEKWTSIYSVTLLDESISLQESIDKLKVFMDTTFKEIDSLFNVESNDN